MIVENVLVCHASVSSTIVTFVQRIISRACFISMALDWNMGHISQRALELMISIWVYSMILNKIDYQIKSQYLWPDWIIRIKVIANGTFTFQHFDYEHSNPLCNGSHMMFVLGDGLASCRNSVVKYHRIFIILFWMFSCISQIYRGTCYGKPRHHNDIISTVRHLKSLATWLFF